MLVAVRAQPLVPLTDTASDPPAAPTLWLEGDRENAPHAAAACATVKLCPPMVAVPVRLVPAVLAATLRPTVPLPVPEPPEVTAIHAALLVAVRAQPLVPLTDTATGPPDAATLWLDGDKENVPHATADWATVKVCPPMVTVPVRLVPAVLAATLRPTVPLPVPEAPEVTAIHAALLVAVRAQPLVPLTDTATGPPDAATFWLDGDSENAPHAAAACATVKVCPPMVAEPVRPVPAVLAATLRPTVPVPVPEPPEVTVIHAALLVAVRAQPLVPLTDTATGPPDAATFWLDGDSENAPHAAAACATVKVRPATVSVPDLDVPAVLACTLKPAAPLPLPDAPVVIVSQAALLAAVHAHPEPAVTLTVPVAVPLPTEVDDEPSE